MTLCQCGCEGEVSREGNRFIKGHNKNRLGHKHTKETRKKMSESHKGHKLSEETKEKISKSHKKNQNNLGYKHTKESRKKISEAKRGHIVNEETRKKLSEANKGFKHPNFIHGKSFILSQHKKHKKQECLFGCVSNNYNLHHEPELDYNEILEWEGHLINLCRSCHKKVHHNTLKLPDNVGILWTKEDIEKE